MDVIRCPICGCDETKQLHTEFKWQLQFFYAICKGCGYVYQQKRYARQIYERLPYQTQQEYESHVERRAIYIVNFCEPRLSRSVSAWTGTTRDEPRKEPYKILDVGCGRGGVMKYVAEYFASFRQLPKPDIEVSGYTLDMGESEATDLKIIYQNVEDEITDKTKYNFIIMSHVVEHFYDLHKALTNVHDVLTKDGFVYIEVPSFHRGEIRIPTIYWPEHLSYFTQNSLRNILEMNGFFVMEMRESKYWGNIKVLARKRTHIESLRLHEDVWHPVRENSEDNWLDYKRVWVQKENWRRTMFDHYRARLEFPYWQWRGNLRQIGANE